MKVICVNNKFIPGNSGDSLLHLLKEGGDYTAVELYADGYLLAETYDEQLRHRVTFDKNRFVAIGGPCEIELHEQQIEKLTAEYVAKYGEPPIVELDPVRFAQIWENVSKELDKKDWA